MKTAFRICHALTLALLLVMTSQAMAVARGASGPAGHMTICTGTGPSVIYVDANGAPTAPPAYCPECALASLSAVRAPASFATFEITYSAVLFASAQTIRRVGPELPTARARAPPFGV